MQSGGKIQYRYPIIPTHIREQGSMIIGCARKERIYAASTSCSTSVIPPVLICHWLIFNVLMLPRGINAIYWPANNINRANGVTFLSTRPTLNDDQPPASFFLRWIDAQPQRIYYFLKLNQRYSSTRHPPFVAILFVADLATEMKTSFVNVSANWIYIYCLVERTNSKIVRTPLYNSLTKRTFY